MPLIFSAMPMARNGAHRRISERSVNTQNVVNVQGLTYRYGRHLALSDVSFEVAQGEIFGLLGPNGGGKSTLLRILSTLMLPESGSAEIAGASVTADRTAVRARIGVLFQSPSLDGKLSARENMVCQGRLYSLRGAELRRRVPRLLEQVGLLDRATELVETFSGGMRRRVEIAKALVHKPRVLFMDEPSTGLDPGARRELWDVLRALSGEGVTTVLSTHLIEEGERCDRLIILDRGRVVARGTPASLRAGVGGDVITVRSDNPERLAEDLAKRFQVTPTLVAGTVRVQAPEGHRLAARIAEEMDGVVRSVTFGKPSLEDVFVQATGSAYGEDHA